MCAFEGSTPRALVFAAGLGTRLKPLTDTMPKALVPVSGRPLLDHVLRKLQAAGVREAVVNVHHFADRIIGWLAAHPVEGLSVAVSDERDFLRETGGGIRYAEPLLLSGPKAPTGRPEGRFLVHNVDILSNLDLCRFASQAPADALATLAVSDRKTQRYFLFKEEDSVSEAAAGCRGNAPSAPVVRPDGPDPLLPVSPSPRLRLVGWTNVATGEVRTPFPDLDVSACRKLAFSGIHLISNRIFDVFREYDTYDPSAVGPAPLGERFSITDFYLRVCAEYPIYGIVPPDFRMIDVGKLDTLAAAEDFLRCEGREV